jgi:hypothetical protein
MKQITTDQREAMLKNLKQMRENIDKQRTLALQMMVHPDATANQIMWLHESMVRTHEGYRKVWKSVREVLVGKKTTEWEMRYGIGAKIDRLKLN